MLSGDDFCALQPGLRGGGAEEQGQGQQIGAAAGAQAPGHQIIVQGLQRRVRSELERDYYSTAFAEMQALI